MNASRHIGNELELMLDGQKPLSMFYSSTMNGLEYEHIPEEEFDVYVRAGRFCKDVFEFQASENPRVLVRYVMYSLKEEVWRLPALKLVLQVRDKTSRPEEGIDRMIGALLGYSEKEIDEYIEGGRNNVYCRGEK